MSIADNVARIKARMAEAAIAAGRRPEEILLCAATKMNDTEAVRQAIAAGVDCCGENAYEGVPVHFIGHLQTNKVKQIVGKVSLIHSIDSVRLLEAVNKEAARQGIVQDVLLEINVAKEESKSGFYPEDVESLLCGIEAFSAIRVLGLMAIPPICQNSTENHKFFQKMYNLAVDIKRKKYDNVCVNILSMGMSGDFADAIACGSTMIRVGTAIFGPRGY